MTQGRELQVRNHLMSLLNIEFFPVLQVDSHGRTLDIPGHVNNLLNPRDTQGNILGRNTGKMEGVQGHLGHGFS